MTDLQLTPSGLVAGDRAALSIPLDTTNPDPFDGNGVHVEHVTIGADAKRFVAKLENPTAPDFDLFVGRGDVALANVECQSATGGSFEACDIDPAPRKASGRLERVAVDRSLIDEHLSSGDRAGLVGREEGDQGADVILGHESPARDPREQLLLGLGRRDAAGSGSVCHRALEKRREYVSGVHRVAGDVETCAGAILSD